MNDHTAGLITALKDLQAEVRRHIRFDVRKHYSLMVADVAASKAIEKALAEADPEATIPAGV